MQHRSPPLRWLAALAAAAVLATACTDDDADPASPAAAEGTSTSTTEVAGADAPPPGLDARIEITNAGPAAPLTADLRVSADVAVVPVVTVSGPGGTVTLPEPEPATEHRIPVVGMRADTEHEIAVELRDADGSVVAAAEALSHTTGPLPEEMPPIDTLVSDPDRMAPGVTLFNLLDIADVLGIDDTEPAEAPWFGWLVAVDATGEVVWLHRAPHPIGDVRMLDDGTILHEYNDTGARRINLFGEVLDEWAGERIRTDLRLDAFGRQVVGDDAIPVDTDAMHHEVGMLPNGNLVTLSTELRAVDGFPEPLCGEDPATFDGTYHLISDIVVEVDAVTGELVREWPIADYFDLPAEGATRNVCGIPNQGVFPNWMYQPLEPRARDWTHGNSVVLDEERNALLISLRHVDAVLALRYEDDESGPAGELLWELGPNGTLELLEGDWSYHQHAPEVQDDGTILLYDNGNGRPDGPPYSRAVRYEVDDEAGTVTELWEHESTQDGQPAFAPFVGDADRLANGNVLITDGGLFGAVDDVSAQIVEVVPADDPAGNEVVFELRVTGGQGWAVYRAERLPSLYG